MPHSVFAVAQHCLR